MKNHKDDLDLVAESKEQLEEICGRLHQAWPSDMICYRGQVSTRPLLPSIRRVRPEQSVTFERLITILWEAYVESALKAIGMRRSVTANYVVAGMALLQHYGFRSWFIDVTDNIDVALFFATHQYSSEVVGLKPHPCFTEHGHSNRLVDHTFALARMVRYVPIEEDKEGVIYVLRVAKSDRHLALDLRSVLTPEKAARVHAQSAMGLLEPADSRGLDDLVVAKVRVRRTMGLGGHTSGTLFPGPDCDEVYDIFLRAPYVLGTDDILEGRSIAYPVLEVPLYATSHKEILSFVKRTNLIIGTSILAYRGLYDLKITKSLNGTLYSLMNATIVQLPISRPDEVSIFSPAAMAQGNESDATIIFHAPESEPIPSDAWPSANLFFELPAHAAAAQFSALRCEAREATIVRGHWVIWSPVSLYIAQVRDNFGEILLEAGAHYDLRDGRFIIDRQLDDCQGNDDQAHYAQLMIFLYFTSRKVNEFCYLHCASPDNYHWYWREQDYREATRLLKDMGPQSNRTFSASQALTEE